MLAANRPSGIARTPRLSEEATWLGVPSAVHGVLVEDSSPENANRMERVCVLHRISIKASIALRVSAFRAEECP